jgi:hypothetical protein
VPPESACQRKLAVTDVASDILTVQTVDLPVQAPLQDTNRRPFTGLAVSFTVLFAAKLAVAVLHVRPQLIPAGELMTVP